MTAKEKRNLLLAAGAVFVALWLVVVAFGDVLGVSQVAIDTIINLSGAVAILAQTYIMKKITSMKDTDGDGVPDELEDSE